LGCPFYNNNTLKEAKNDLMEKFRFRNFLKKKGLILLILCSLLVLVLSHKVLSSSLLVSGSNFSLTFNAGDSLTLCGRNLLVFDVESGLWNGSSGAITVYNDRGRFSFYAENDTVLEVSSPDAPSGLDLSVSGASYTQPSKFVWLVTITTNNTVTFVWNWRLPSWLDLYFMFGVGMAGLIMMVFAPAWVAMGVRRNAFQVDKIERIGYAVLIFCVGFGLFCCWLWS